MSDLDAVFRQLLNLAPQEREPLLDRLSTDDRRELETLLAADEKANLAGTQFLRPIPLADTLAENSDYSAHSMEQEFLPPKEVAGYKLSRELGRGSMGVVYRAQRLADGLDVAIKLISPQASSLEKLSQMFQREAEILTSLSHKRIVRCIEHGLHQGKLFMVMEYVRDHDIMSLLGEQSRPKQIKIACGIVGYVLSALEYAHEKSIVHRDIKPSNVLTYLDAGRLKAKVADFGLAKNFESAGITTISCDGDTKGTIAFMAPEQFGNARYADPTADIYSAGACLYYYLAGSSPYAEYDTGHPLSVLRAMRSHGPTPIGSVASDITGPIADIVTQAVSPSKEDRFKTARKMREALQDATGIVID